MAPNLPPANGPNPSIEPTTAASLQAFAEACANGSIDAVAILATCDGHYPNTEFHLNHGLLASITHKQLPIARFLLSCGAITPSIAMAADRVRVRVYFRVFS